MTTAPPELRGVALRLALARALAWALLLGGWLVLGALGLQHLPLWAGGQVPVALWLMAVAGGLALVPGLHLTLARLRTALASAGSVAAAALLALAHGSGSSGAWLLLAALVWGGLLVAASLCVRALRLASPQQPPAPFAAAAAGAVLAWAVAGDLAAVRNSADGVALALLAAALGLVVLAPRGAGTVSACRAGLFDCALHLPGWRDWLDPAQWPRHAAMLVMLPMMAALPRMAEWCGAEGDAALGAPATVALHLAAMLLPAWALGSAQRWRLARGVTAPAREATLRRSGVTLAMLAGGLALLVWPGLSGLMLASLWQAVAWSLAWGASMAHRAAPPAVAPSPAAPRHRLARIAAAAAATGAGVLALGVAVDANGPAALASVHGLLAALAGAGAAWLRLRWRPCPAPTQEHPT